jgi:hypothetical protein
VFSPPLGGRCASPSGCPATSSLLPSQRRCGHKAASLLIPKGASVNAVRKQLSHATASITLDTYGDLLPDELDALAGRLQTSTAGR